MSWNLTTASGVLQQMPFRDVKTYRLKAGTHSQEFSSIQSNTETRSGSLPFRDPSSARTARSTLPLLPCRATARSGRHGSRHGTVPRHGRQTKLYHAVPVASHFCCDERLYGCSLAFDFGQLNSSSGHSPLRIQQLRSRNSTQVITHSVQILTGTVNGD